MRLLPSAVSLTLPPTDVSFGPKEGQGISGNYRIRIANSIINIECDVSSLNKTEFYFIMTNALGLARIEVNLASFAAAQPMHAIFDTVIDENGTPNPFLIQHSAFRSINTAVPLNDPIAFNHLCHEIMRGTPYAFDVLNDARIAINEPIFSVLHLNRALEGIKQDISGAIKNDKIAWQLMQEALNVDEKFLRQITDLSKGPRHARIDTIHGKDAMEAARRTWMIVNRYLEYINRKRASLSLMEFPLLQEQP
jgi:hypothetical protein